MADDWVRPPVPDAPLYLLVDMRCPGHVLYRFHSVVTNPMTGELAKAPRRPALTPPDLAILDAQRAELLRLDPSVIDGNLILFDRPDIPMDASLMEKSRRVYGEKPKNIAHWDRISGVLEEWRDAPRWYQLASTEWKSIIEELEPDPPEFFPFNIEFALPSQSSSHHCFVLRTRALIQEHKPKCFYPYAPFSSTEKSFDFQFVDRERRPVSLLFSKQAVVGRHWFDAADHWLPTFPYDHKNRMGPIVSQQMLSRLMPLIPDRVYPVPINVA